MLPSNIRTAIPVQTTRGPGAATVEEVCGGSPRQTCASQLRFLLRYFRAVDAEPKTSKINASTFSNDEGDMKVERRCQEAGGGSADRHITRFQD